jgi:hypothetical protein
MFPASQVTKAQHGCIDCLALMICAELQISDSSSQSSKANMVQNESKFIEEVMDRPGMFFTSTVLALIALSNCIWYFCTCF